MLFSIGHRNEKGYFIIFILFSWFSIHSNNNSTKNTNLHICSNLQYYRMGQHIMDLYKHKTKRTFQVQTDCESRTNIVLIFIIVFVWFFDDNNSNYRYFSNNSEKLGIKIQRTHFKMRNSQNCHKFSIVDPVMKQFQGKLTAWNV